MEDHKRHVFIWKLLYHPVRLLLRLKFNYHPRVEPVNGPCLIVSNHCTDWDPLLLGITIKNHAYFIASEHIFRNPGIARLLHWLQAPISRRKGDTAADTALTAIRHMRKGHSVVVFAEGNRSFNGLTGPIVESTAKLARAGGGSLVTHRFRGGYFTSPRWAGADIRRGRMTGEIVRVYTREELRAMTPAQIADVIRRDIFEDAYATQKEWMIPYRGRRLAQHLERALYLCPVCGGMNTLKSRGDELSCAACGSRGIYTPLGYLESDDFPFSTVLDWDRWQAERLPRLLSEAGSAPLTGDDDTVLWEAGEDHSRSRIASGPVMAYADRLECAGTVIPYKDIGGIGLEGPQMLTLTAGGRYLTVTADRVCCLRKYIAIYYAATDPEKILSV